MVRLRAAKVATKGSRQWLAAIVMARMLPSSIVEHYARSQDPLASPTWPPQDAHLRFSIGDKREGRRSPTAARYSRGEARLSAAQGGRYHAKKTSCAASNSVILRVRAAPHQLHSGHRDGVDSIRGSSGPDWRNNPESH